MVSCLWDVLRSVSSVPLKLWTLTDLAKFRPLLPFLPSAYFLVLLVLQYFCSFPFMFSQQASLYEETVVGLCCLPTSCFQWVLHVGMTLVKVSLLLSLFGPEACGR